MAVNNLQRLNFLEAVSFANGTLSAIGKDQPNPFLIPADQVSKLTSTTAAAAAANANYQNAYQAFRNASAARLTAHKNCVDSIATIARTVYATPSLTTAQIEALGFKPRATTKTKVTPKTPAKLTATLLPSTEIALNFSRSGNPQGTTFVVESQSGTGPWVTAGVTTKARFVVTGVPAGVTTNFRITAVKDEVASAASPVATAYPSSNAAPELRLAA